MKGFLTLCMLAATAAAAWFLPAKARHHYSATGVVYTTEYLTLHLPTGVVGFPPGSRLSARFDVHVPDKEVLTDGTHSLAVDPESLTHDIEYAQDLADADQSNQTQSDSLLAKLRADHAANQHAADVIHATDIDGVNASLVASSMVGNYVSGLNGTPGAAAYGSYGGGGSVGVHGGGGNTTNYVTVIENGHSVTATTARPAGNYVTAAAPRSAMPAAPQRALYTGNVGAANHPSTGALLGH